MPIADLGLLALAAIWDGRAEDGEMVAEHALSNLKSLGRRPMKEDVAIEDDAAAVEFLGPIYDQFLQEDIELCRRLGVL